MYCVLLDVLAQHKLSDSRGKMIKRPGFFLHEGESELLSETASWQDWQSVGEVAVTTLPSSVIE